MVESPLSHLGDSGQRRGQWRTTANNWQQPRTTGNNEQRHAGANAPQFCVSFRFSLKIITSDNSNYTKHKGMIPVLIPPHPRRGNKKAPGQCRGPELFRYVKSVQCFSPDRFQARTGVLWKTVCRGNLNEVWMPVVDHNRYPAMPDTHHQRQAVAQVFDLIFRQQIGE